MVQFKKWVPFRNLLTDLCIEDLGSFLYLAEKNKSLYQLKMAYEKKVKEMVEIELEAEILENIFFLPALQKSWYKHEIKSIISHFYDELGAMFYVEDADEEWINYKKLKFTPSIEKSFVDKNDSDFLIEQIEKIGNTLHYIFFIIDKDLRYEVEIDEKVNESNDEIFSLTSILSRYELMNKIGVFDLPIFKGNEIPQNKKWELLSKLLDAHERTAKKYFNKEVVPKKDTVERIKKYIDNLGKIK